MSNRFTCPICGLDLPSDAPRGHCPRCLYDLGIGIENPPGAQEPEESIEQPAELTSLVETSFPREFGDYELLEEIGVGGMGVVYQARHRELDREVALKMLRFGPHASSDEVKRFRAEAVTAAALHHPNIVTIHDVGLYNGQHFIAMDLVRGHGLDTVVTGTPLPARQAAAIVQAVAEAIHHAHEHGILHRDLKPSNVIIDDLDVPHLTDFGLARRLDGSTELTVTGQVLGSPSYISPEQAAGGSRGLSRRSDVYGLGAILYQALTGRPPFQGGTIADVIQQVLGTDPIRPRQLNRGIPRDLETICLKCLEKNPQQRYATAGLLEADLKRFLAGESVLARPVGPAGRLCRWCRRKPTIAALSAGMFLLVLTLAVGGPLVAVHEARLRAAADAAVLVAHPEELETLLADRDPKEVLARLQSALPHFPENPYLWGAIARLLNLEGHPEEALRCFTRAVELADAAPGVVTAGDKTRFLLYRSHARELAGDLSGAGRDACRVRGIAFRDERAADSMIDLSVFYDFAATNRFVAPEDEWIRTVLDIPGSDLVGLEAGIYDWGGVGFDVRGVILLRGNITRLRKFREAVTGIPVGLRCERLHALLGAAWNAPDGTEIATLTMHCADGSSIDLPVLYGIHVQDYICYEQGAHEHSLLPDAEVVWTGKNGFSQGLSGHLRLYHAVWENPKPNADVRSLDFASTTNACAPFLIAISVE